MILPALEVCGVCSKPEPEHGRATHKFERNKVLPEWRGWHAFRRGLATNLNRLGVDDSVIQRILRHSALTHHDNTSGRNAMITIAQDRDVVTLINSFTCEPQNQQHLIDAWIRATEERLGQLPGIISAALHRSKDGTRVVNYAQWRRAENWENLFRIGSESWFREMAKYAKPDAHLYEVCYLLDKTTGQKGR